MPPPVWRKAAAGAHTSRNVTIKGERTRTYVQGIRGEVRGTAGSLSNVSVNSPALAPASDQLGPEPEGDHGMISAVGSGQGPDVVGSRNAGVVFRPGLIGRLGGPARVTVVSAPAGSGKTVL